MSLIKNTSMVVFFFLFIVHASYAETKPGPHGGQVVSKSDASFEVKYHEDSGTIEVYAIKQPKKINLVPKSLVLFYDSKNEQSIELKAMQPPGTSGGNMLYYQGNLSQQGGSYMGAELRFETGVKALKALKFVPRFQSVK